MKTTHIGLIALLTLLLTHDQAWAQVPGTINYQGRAIVNGTSFTGTGNFKFALVNKATTTTYWSNDGTSAGGAEPASGVSIDVSKGLFAVILGDTNLPNMVTIPASVFQNPDIHLRAWLDVSGGSHLHLSPDQALASVGYALVSASVVPDSISSLEVVDGSISGADIAGDAVQGANIADGTVTGADIANNSIQSVDIEDGTVAGADIADGSVQGADIDNETIQGANIQDGSIAGADIANGSIQSVDIEDGTVAGADIADGSVQGADINNGTIQVVDLDTANVDGRYVLKGGDTMTGALAVDGIVESTTGGIRFPDSTTQITAAVGGGASGWTPGGGDVFTAVPGNVGVGDNSPQAKLDVNQAGTADIFQLQDNGSPVMQVHDGGDAEIDGSTFFVQASSNRVGIGDMEPTAQLTVRQIVGNDSFFEVKDSLGFIEFQVREDEAVAENIQVEGVLKGTPGGAGGARNLQIESDASMTFMCDNNNNSSAADVFEWFTDGAYSTANKIAELESNGDLEIRGAITQNFLFDIAEAFLNGEGAEPGDVVRVDPARSNRVLLSAGENDRLVLGIISTDPGMVLGGSVFDLATLEKWDPKLKARFLQEESDIIRAIVDSEPSLAENTVKLRELALKKFASRELAHVALAGRVPVKVDTRNGAIKPGDLLAPSPVPGVAMKATKAGPVIGTALESFKSGRGKVLTYVQRSWFTPSDEDLERTVSDLKRENNHLKARLAELESTVSSLLDQRRMYGRVAMTTEREALSQ